MIIVPALPYQKIQYYSPENTVHTLFIILGLASKVKNNGEAPSHG